MAGSADTDTSVGDFYMKLICTVMCFSIGTPKNNNFSICSNGKFIYFRCPKIWANYRLIIMYSNIGTPNYHHFPFGTNGKIVVLCVPILKHCRVCATWRLNRELSAYRIARLTVPGSSLKTSLMRLA